MAFGFRSATAAGRRLFLKSTLASALPLAIGSSSIAKAQATRRTYVLVHGAWHGGWCWQPVRERLEALGHRVLTPTLTGLADRSHLLSDRIVLQTHIDDIVNLYQWEDLTNVVLVGHSYGGWPVSGALERVHDRTTAVVFVDAFVPESGQAGRDLTSPGIRKILDDSLAKGEIARPAPDASVFNLANPKDVPWLNERMTPQPNGVAVAPIQLRGGREKVARKIYVRGTRYANSSFDGYLAQARQTPDWQAHAVDCGHHVMLDQSEGLTKILTEA